MANTVASGISGLAQSFKSLKPDLVVILGDRVEILSAAIASLYMNIPLAHLHGGDVGAGCVDNQVRDALTKMSSLHFAASERSAKRLLSMGEEKRRIFNVGSPAIDFISNFKPFKKAGLFRKYGLDPAKKLILVVQHPLTTEIELAKKQMEETLEAVSRLCLQILFVYPNTDAGGESIIRVIERYEKIDLIKTIANASHGEYLSFLKYAAALVGNSSSGIIEAPAFKLPVVNIGIRQQGRERSLNVIDVPHERRAILKAVKKALNDKMILRRAKKSVSPYGDGQAAPKIVKILSAVKLDKDLLQKRTAG
jgi:GDP/UDP-N,N'-diacetylbacillosamine 2-epimerase (hydrolysing)